MLASPAIFRSSGVILLCDELVSSKDLELIYNNYISFFGESLEDKERQAKEIVSSAKLLDALSLSNCAEQLLNKHDEGIMNDVHATHFALLELFSMSQYARTLGTCKTTVDDKLNRTTRLHRTMLMPSGLQASDPLFRAHSRVQRSVIS